MAFNSLTFDGINSLDYGIYITGESVYDVPERDVEPIEIAGRNGDYLLDKGRWKNIDVTYHCGCFGADQSEFASKIRTFRNLLASKRGYKRITDTYNTTEYRMGTLVNPVEVDSVSYKRAGEFDLTFNCKPQRYLTSGETASTVANNGTLTNPTAYDASPLLAVKGYGTITFNGYSITINNETLGTVTLWNNSDIGVNTPASKTVSFDTNLLASGNTFTVSPSAKVYLKPGPLDDFDHITGTHTLSGASDYTNALASGNAVVREIMGTLQFAKGTQSTKSDTFSMTVWDIYGYDIGHASITMSVAYDGSNTVTYSLSSSIVSPATFTFGMFTLSTGEGIGNSTVSILGNPTYIDCELGEAYMIKSNEYVPLNRYIDLGSDLPTLASGSNTFTKTNTITELKVTPRWWQL